MGQSEVLLVVCVDTAVDVLDCKVSVEEVKLAEESVIVPVVAVVCCKLTLWVPRFVSVLEVV